MEGLLLSDQWRCTTVPSASLNLVSLFYLGVVPVAACQAEGILSGRLPLLAFMAMMLLPKQLDSHIIALSSHLLRALVAVANRIA